MPNVELVPANWSVLDDGFLRILGGTKILRHYDRPIKQPRLLMAQTFLIQRLQCVVSQHDVVYLLGVRSGV